MSSAHGIQQRLEGSEFGRGLINSFIVVTLLAVVAINLPESQLRHDLLRPGQPYLNALGLDQSWALFSPDPRRAVLDLRAVVSFDDGSTSTWEFPHRGALLGTYSDYRWRKWAENVTADANADALWRRGALWAAAQEMRPNHRAVRVTLVRRFAPLQPPGQTPSRLPWQEQAYYVLQLPGPARPGVGP